MKLDDPSMTFYALGETHQTTVRVVASQNTTPGDYMYNIQAVGPTGLGWGISNHTLMVIVSQPVALDTTPPDVKITSPVEGQAFTFCLGDTKVPVTISAVDAQSVVTAVGGTANGLPFVVSPFTPGNAVDATGVFLGSGVGAYTLGPGPRAPAGLERRPRSVSVSTTRCPGCRRSARVARSTARR